MRKLATIQYIKSLEPIEGADRIELATINGWRVIVAKDVGHTVGDMVVYCEIDSFLPEKPEFEFLRKSSYRTNANGNKGFRLRTMKMRGVVSQGLILPLSVVMNSNDVLRNDITEGHDVTEALGIEKFEPIIPACLSGQVEGAFPSFIRKTDEERVQNIPMSKIEDYTYTLSEKLDGTSFTGYHNDGHVGVCTRNWEINHEDESSTHWRIAREVGLPEKLKALGMNIAIQGELIGPGIQGNRYKLKKVELRVFNAFDIDNQEYISKSQLETLARDLGLETCPRLDVNLNIKGKTREELINMAEGKSVLAPDVEREGMVWVAQDSPERISFKTISNKFLLKGGD